MRATIAAALAALGAWLPGCQPTRLDVEVPGPWTEPSIAWCEDRGGEPMALPTIAGTWRYVCEDVDQ